MPRKFGIAEIAEAVRQLHEADKSKKILDVQGATLHDALASASTQLGLAISKLDYEILEQGSAGIMGAFKKEWKIRAYPSHVAPKVEVAETHTEDSQAEIAESKASDKHVDGAFFVRLAHEGALLKVIKEKGRGKAVVADEVFAKIALKKIKALPDKEIAHIISEAKGTWEYVGTFEANPANDSLMIAEIFDNDMKAQITMSTPGPGGLNPSRDMVIACLKLNGVNFGYLEDILEEIEQSPKYTKPIVVAQGRRPVSGKDAHIEYYFETERAAQHLREAADGKMNFKELRQIQNVVAGQVLAVHVPPSEGDDGMTVTGKIIPARDGSDIPMPLGRNVRLREDGHTIIAERRGQVVLLAGKINVEEVHVIPGNVDLKTGNIIFLGTVIIHGDVADGFSVKASGNIDIFGSVGKCEIVAEGEVVVHLGIAGKDGGFVQAGKNIWSKFIENCTVEAGENVIVSDGLINSKVFARNKIICQGKRAAIVGGLYQARDEINAKHIGSSIGGSETVVEVGYDPTLTLKLEERTGQLKEFQRKIEENEKNITNFLAIQRQRGELMDEQKALLENAQAKNDELQSDLKFCEREIQSLERALTESVTTGKISVSGFVYAGVKLVIRDYKEDIKRELKHVTFYLDDKMIRMSTYQEPKDEFLKKGPPDEHTTD